MARPVAVSRTEIGPDDVMNFPLVFISSFERFHSNDYRELEDADYITDPGYGWSEKFEGYTGVLSGLKSDAKNIVKWLEMVVNFIGQGHGYVTGKKEQIDGLFGVLDAEAKRWAKSEFKFSDFIMNSASLSEYSKVTSSMDRLGTILARFEVSNRFVIELTDEVTNTIVGIERELTKDQVRFGEYVRMKVEYWNELSEKLRKDELAKRREEINHEGSGRADYGDSRDQVG